jgi:type IV pilus assembly protein PilE
MLGTCPRGRLAMTRSKGFTLIELMVVVAIVALLLSIAIPAYNDSVRKGRRAEATSELGKLQMAQERWRADHATYGTLANIGGVTPLASGYYTVAVATPGGNCASGVAASNANSFSITATATGAQASDTGCATIVLTSLCGTVSKTSTGGAKCW